MRITLRSWPWNSSTDPTYKYTEATFFSWSLLRLAYLNLSRVLLYSLKCVCMPFQDSFFSPFSLVSSFPYLCCIQMSWQYLLTSTSASVWSCIWVKSVCLLYFDMILLSYPFWTLLLIVLTCIPLLLFTAQFFLSTMYWYMFLSVWGCPDRQEHTESCPVTNLSVALTALRKTSTGTSTLNLATPVRDI